MSDLPTEARQDGNLLLGKGGRSNSFRIAEAAVKEAKEAEKKLKRIKVVFCILFCSNFIANFDHGIIPALNTTIKEDYDLNNA